MHKAQYCEFCDSNQESQGGVHLVTSELWSNISGNRKTYIPFMPSVYAAYYYNCIRPVFFCLNETGDLLHNCIASVCRN